MLSSLLKIRLLQSVNTFRFSRIFRRKQLTYAFLMLVFFVGLLVANAWVNGDIGSAYSANYTVTKSVIIGGIIVAVLFAFALFRSNDPLDPRKFFRHHIENIRLSLGLLLATTFSIQFLLVTVFTVSLLSIHVTSAETAWLVLVAAFFILGHLTVYIRFGSALATRLIERPRLRFFLAFFMTGFAVIQTLTMVFWALGQNSEMTWAALSALVKNLQYVPVFSPWFIVPLAAEGNAGEAGMMILLSALFLTVLVACWLLLFRFVKEPNFSHESRERSGRLGVFSLFPATKAGAVGARSMKYWLTDPRYIVPAIALPVLPLFVTTTLGFVGVPLEILVLLPLPIFSLMLGWFLHNDISMDGSAFWIHLASAGTERADRLGRIMPPFLIWVLVVTIGGIFSVNLVRNVWIFPVLVGLSAAAFGAAVGLSSISSVTSAYPTPAPHENPFRQPVIERGASSGAAIVLLTAAAFIAIPLTFYIFGLFGASRFFALMTLGSGLLTGLLLLYIGIRYSSYLLRKRGPEIISVILNN